MLPTRLDLVPLDCRGLVLVQLAPAWNTWRGPSFVLRNRAGYSVGHGELTPDGARTAWLRGARLPTGRRPSR